MKANFICFYLRVVITRERARGSTTGSPPVASCQPHILWLSWPNYALFIFKAWLKRDHRGDPMVLSQARSRVITTHFLNQSHRHTPVSVFGKTALFLYVLSSTHSHFSSLQSNSLSFPTYIRPLTLIESLHLSTVGELFST